MPHLTPCLVGTCEKLMCEMGKNSNPAVKCLNPKPGATADPTIWRQIIKCRDKGKLKSKIYEDHSGWFWLFELKKDLSLYGTCFDAIASCNTELLHNERYLVSFERSRCGVVDHAISCWKIGLPC